MKHYPLWFAATSLVLSLETGAMAQEPAPIAKPAVEGATAPAETAAIPEIPAAPLDNLTEHFTKLDEEFQAAVSSARALLETEVAAGRLSEPLAQSLRMTLRSAGTFVGSVDLRNLLSAARVPAENREVFKAIQRVEDTWSSVQSRKEAMQRAAVTEAVRRGGELVENAKTAAEADPLIASVDAAQELLTRRSEGMYPGAKGTQSLKNLPTQLRNFQSFLSARESGNSSRISQTINTLLNSPEYQRSVLDDKVRARIEKELKPFNLAMEEAQNALDAGIEAGKPAAELMTLLDRFELAADKVPTFAGKENRQMVSSYRSMINALNQTGQEGSGWKQAIRNASEYVSGLGPKRAAMLRASLQKRERQAEEMIAKMAKEQGEQWRARLATVKDPGELSQLALDIQAAPTANRFDRAGDSESNVNLARTLSSLAAAWSGASLAALAQSSGDSNYARSTYSKEIDALRKRVEREIVARVMKAPELNQSPLAERDTPGAIEELSADLFKRQEWRRLLQLVETRQLLQGSRGYTSPMRETDLAGALRAFIAGGNFETAEQWEDAVIAYKAVLRATDERAPIQAAALRLKELKKKHPDAFKAVAAAGPWTPRAPY